MDGSSWEVIAASLTKAGWSWGWVSAVDSEGRTIWIDGRASRRRKALVVHAGGKADDFYGIGISDS
jgi:hypothetical protein